MARGWKARQKERVKANKPDPLMEAIALLLSLGWTTAGRTARETRRYGSHDVEVGDRRRFVLPYTPRVCTIGRDKTCFYRVGGNMQPIDHMTVPTKDLKEVERVAKGVPA
jgi:hypothetical protein